MQYTYLYVHGVEWVMSVIKDCVWKLIQSLTNIIIIYD